MDSNELKQLLVNQTNKAFSDYALHHSVGLAIYQDKEIAHIGSGTLVHLGEYYFIFTASHCIKDTDFDKIKIAYLNPEYSKRFKIIRTGYSDDSSAERIDVGYIEINSDIANQIPIEFLGVENISIEYDFTNSVAFLYGYPAEIIPRKDAEEGLYRFRSLSFVTFEATGRILPDNINEETEIFLKYPENAQYGMEIIRKLPQPHGISGGSIWIYDPNNPDPLYSIRTARYIGIQKSWFRDNGVVVGNKIKELLMMIANDYDELKDNLNKQFNLG